MGLAPSWQFAKTWKTETIQMPVPIFSQPLLAEIVDWMVDDLLGGKTDSAIDQPVFSAYADHVIHFADVFQFPFLSLTLGFAQNYTSLDYSVLGAVLGRTS